MANKDKDEEVVTVDETQTVEETPTPTPTEPEQTPTPETAGGDTGNADLGVSGTAYQPDPEREAVYLRQRALELASQGSTHEAKEPILAVLARAVAYADYMLTGNTGIVA